jgi:hypothetical protein
MAELAQRRPNAERYNLLGSAHKRLALIERHAGRPAAERRALQDSLAAYRQAVRRARHEQLADLFHPAMNCLALELVLRLRAGRAPALDPALRRAARSSLLAKSRDDPDFWSQLGLVELEVLDALAEGRLAAAAPRIGRALAELHARVASTGWWGSGADQADLIYGAWMRHGQAADRGAARGLWRQLLRYGGKTEAEITRITAETEAWPSPRSATPRA